ncbi:succinate dehydrogenase and fumarate reductase iron-sulfur protein [Cellulomonas flavigena DSM 20109]|uniref:succinate dehydrogenase n=1 Tax=Cellulomonas flavigena (strain ATCC 482 / DSM 20109 / BCRC 11376 / JCM 18109 / NBRC 3775 / NCIMB 8073 / NRS 134) TaxID=446466 RepID=D5UF02_CELFN|nr:succinate dehydrogenase/fumarate reductase iron-sulfur subunit [Cellulomonas flavigena]ADG74812.1 succinate dehydrogenase and fumarate reductase iron-sulfur protein [Cellulomonas flavigena DSM 20109]
MKLTLEVWRQRDAVSPGAFETYEVTDATPEMTLLELLDRLNDQLVVEGREPVAFESDCREGICGCCGMDVDGRPHGPQANTPSCEQHVRSFQDGDRVVLEPLRSAAFPVVRDLVVDRSALDRVIQAGGHVAVDAGTAPDADATTVGYLTAEEALDFAACIGCGACVAACPNGSAMLFTGARITHLAKLPQTRAERGTRARSMVAQMEHDFGPCSTYGECAIVCPAGIPLSAIAAVGKERMRAFLRNRAD